MANEAPLERAAEAGADAANARRLVVLLRAAALAGGQHDPDLFDAAVLGHRRAQRRAQAALAALARQGRASETRAGRRAA